MKNILVPTDFSDVSENAAHFAAEIAKKSNAKITLLHVYQIPVAPFEVPVMAPTISQVERTCKEALIQLRAKIHTRHGPHIKVDYAIRCGFAVQEIRDFMQEQSADLVVMGMRGAGFAGEHLIGSVTTSLMRQSNIPILAVNKDSEFKGMKKIVFAYDYTSLENSKTLGALKSFGQLFRSHVYVLKVCQEAELEKVPEIPEAVAGVRMDHLLEEYDHSFHFATGKNVIDGINDFVSKKDADLVVMIPHKQSFLGRMFLRSESKHMAFRLKTPLLVLPE